MMDGSDKSVRRRRSCKFLLFEIKRARVRLCVVFYPMGKMKRGVCFLYAPQKQCSRGYTYRNVYMLLYFDIVC